ncbi:MAG TPA: hypothetical protein VFS47_06810 [Steroidobacteraceae bacterium]|nr:hypothetical protein [Steroidobacteraceae bacterium]
MLHSVLWNEMGRIVVVAGVPIGLVVFVWGVRHLRGTLENSIHVSLLNRYQDSLRTVAESWADLSKRSHADSPASYADDTRTRVMASLLVTLFEEAFLLMYQHSWAIRRNRHWLFWNQRLYEWCAIAEFRELLPQLLRGRDPEFVRYCLGILERERSRYESAAAHATEAAEAELAFTSPMHNPWIHAANSTRVLRETRH